MEFIYTFYNYFYDTIKKGSLGFSVFEIILIISFFIIAIFIRGFFAKIIIFKIKKIVQKTSNKIDDHLFEALAPPLKILPLIFYFIFMGSFFEIEDQMNSTFDKINRSLLTIFIFWFLHQFLAPMSYIFYRLEKLLSKALVNWLLSSLKYLILFLGFVAVLDTWGIKIGPVIAGLGLFGVAVALGAQDLFKNLISGILIILEKRFKLGDIIEVPGRALGTVEHMGFRSTIIRQFDTTLIYLPNYIFSESAIINYSHRYYRQIKWTIGLTYDTKTEQLKKICQEIENYISKSSNFIVNDEYQLFVRIDRFNNSSIDLLVYTFTNTNDWSRYLSIKEELAYNIKEIVQINKSSFAFPSQSIYVEKK